MDKQREAMVRSLIDLVDNWPSKDLIDYVKVSLWEYYKDFSFQELEEEYMIYCAAQEYPETFPEGYKEP